MDMLRYHKFTIGWAWASDYGTAEDADQFRTLLAYSPYHNAQTSRPYPPTLVTTAERDDRVVPLHSFKYTAAMQHAQCGDAPIMIRIETRAGHGAGRPVQMVIDEATDQMAFLTWALGEG
jgi:prolyl oligopeptidase